MNTEEQVLSVLVGPACPACASDDLRWTAPLGAVQWGQCRHCGTEYHWYRSPELHAADARSGAPCPGCGPDDQDFEFCEDCELSDCAYCGSPTNRYLLSEDLACATCVGEAA